MRDTRALATRGQVAEYLGIPVGTLTQWAHKGTGPRYIRVGRHTRYDWADVTAWINARRVEQDAGGDAA